jgi:hypothetical protein
MAKRPESLDPGVLVPMKVRMRVGVARRALHSGWLTEAKGRGGDIGELRAWRMGRRRMIYYTRTPQNRPVYRKTTTTRKSRGKHLAPSLYWYVINTTYTSSIHQRCPSRHSPLPLVVTFQTFRTHRLARICFRLLSGSPATQW